MVSGVGEITIACGDGVLASGEGQRRRPGAVLLGPKPLRVLRERDDAAGERQHTDCPNQRQEIAVIRHNRATKQITCHVEPTTMRAQQVMNG